LGYDKRDAPARKAICGVDQLQRKSLAPRLKSLAELINRATFHYKCIALEAMRVRLRHISRDL
jgi:hypothetical protein